MMHSDWSSQSHFQKRILIVENDFLLLDLYASHYRKAGYEVTTAESPHEGIIQARQLLPDVILFGELLPRYRGKTLLEHLHQDVRLSSVPVGTLFGKNCWCFLGSLEVREQAAQQQTMRTNKQLSGT